MKKWILVAVASLSLAACAGALDARPQETQELRLNRETSFVLFELMAVMSESDSVVSVIRIIPMQRKGADSGEVDLQEGDVILMANGRRICGVKDLHEIYDKLQTGETFKLGVRRGEETFMRSVSKMDPEKMQGGGMIIRRSETDDKK